jgi:hypothetical protein
MFRQSTYVFLIHNCFFNIFFNAIINITINLVNRQSKYCNVYNSRNRS